MVSRTFIAVVLTLAVTSVAVAAGSPSTSRPPSRPPNSYDQGVKAVQAGDYTRALTLLKKVVEAEPRNADAWNYIGLSYRNLKQLDQALAAYQKALAIDPNHLGANEYLGELYVQTGQLEKAQEILKKLGALCPAGCKEHDDLKKAIAARGPAPKK